MLTLPFVWDNPVSVCDSMRAETARKSRLRAYIAP